MVTSRPVVRVEDATLARDDGPVRVTVSRLASPQAVADALASAGGRTVVDGDRLTAVTTPTRLVDAVGRSLGRADAEALDVVLREAIVAWHAPPPDLRAGGITLRCSQRPLVMGIVNVTPDSFSDGGRFYDGGHPETALTHARSLVAAGADLIDVGGESTRPGAEPVGLDEELARVVPVVGPLADQGVVVSVDTSKAEVARAAVEEGACIVNDVTAGRGDGSMLPEVASLRAGYIVMHMRGEPRTMQRDPRYEDVVAEVFEFLAEAAQAAVAAGIQPERIAIDPGIGFGKSLEHNVSLLRRLRELTSLGRPVLLGASRKSFIGRVGGGEETDDRLSGSLAAAVIGVMNGAAIVRVHDVAATTRALALADAVAGPSRDADDAQTGGDQTGDATAPRR
jgi:dihydropteroate synthase